MMLFDAYAEVARKANVHDTANALEARLKLFRESS
jgi:hypothetical protein